VRQQLDPRRRRVDTLLQRLEVERAAPRVGDDDLAVDPPLREDPLHLADAGGERVRLVEAGHHHGDLRVADAAQRLLADLPVVGGGGLVAHTIPPGRSSQAA
jgi:hypothetical protein